MSNPGLRHATALKYRKRFEFVAALMAKLAAREPSISHHDKPAAHGGFVFKLAAKLEKSHVGDGTRQTPVPHHALDMQVFNANRVEPPGDIRSKLVQGIIPDIRDSLSAGSNCK